MKLLKPLAIILCLIGIIYQSMHIPSLIDQTIGKLPMLHDGRVKPIDTFARHTLLQIQGRLTISSNPNLSPTEWLYQLITNHQYDASMPIILVEHPNLFDGIDKKYFKQKYRVSETFLDKHIDHILPLIKSAELVKKDERSPFQQAAILVFNRYNTIKSLRTSFFPSKNKRQLTFWNDMIALSQHIPIQTQKSSKELTEFYAYYKILETYTIQHTQLQLIVTKTTASANNTSILWASLTEAALHPSILHKQLLSSQLLLSDAVFMNNESLIQQYSNDILMHFKSIQPRQFMQLKLEYWFNVINPFIISLFIYVIITLLSFLSSFFKRFNLDHVIKWAWISALSFHAFGLISRSIILLRPPVINLYSSAIFIAFVTSIIGFILYNKSKQTLYSGYIGALSALSLIVAYHLSLTGDTLEVMQAVLNSNFWLSTHVVSMTIGYAILFMAGFMAIAYILLGTLSKGLTPERDQHLSKLVYIFLMIALFFNFLGTVLGGIWADQSWGRFWGWDPKENGAILIVLWIAIALHMKWGRLIKSKGLMIMAVLGNIVCAWSWKGTNMLGIGLHSYGVTEKTFYWLTLFFVSQLIIVILGSLPDKYWRSNITK